MQKIVPAYGLFQVTNQEAVKKVLTHEASSENSSERQTIDSQCGSKLQAEGLQNENKAAGFESEDKNKALDFEILERVSIESLSWWFKLSGQTGSWSDCSDLGLHCLPFGLHIWVHYLRIESWFWSFNEGVRVRYSIHTFIKRPKSTFYSYN